MNHPSDDPTSCCPTCAGEGTLDAAGFDDWAAVLARDADVRTLDETYGPEWYAARGREGDVHIYVRGESGPLGVGATPDEARAKAAAWVREQARKAET